MYKVTLIQGKNDMAFRFMSIEKALSFVEHAIAHSVDVEIETGTIRIVAEVEKYSEPF